MAGAALASAHAGEHRNSRRQWAGISRVSGKRARWRAAILPAGGKGRAVPGTRAQRHRQRLGLVIAVDGRNIINGAKSELARSEPMYVLDALRYAGLRRLARHSTPSTSSISPTGATRTPRRSATVLRAASSPSQCMAKRRRRFRCPDPYEDASAAPILPASRPQARRRPKNPRAAAVSRRAPAMATDTSITPCRSNSSRVRTPTAATSSSTNGVTRCAESISSSAARRTVSGTNQHWASRRRLRAGTEHKQRDR